jgi:tetratricopeptide (TPR) repeat protein
VDADNVIVEGKDRLPADREIAFWWADLAAQRADWREAASRWLSVRVVFPTELRCTIDAARALTNVGESTAADALVFEAQTLFPDDPHILSGWADVADHQRDWPVAAERWKRVQERFPAEKRAYKHEVRAREKAGDLDRAEEVARRAIELFHDQVDVILQAAAIAANRGDLATALERNRAAYALDRSNLDALQRYVAALTRMDRRSDAVIVLDTAIARDPDNETLVRWRIESALRTKDFDDALNVWHRLVDSWAGDREFPSAMAQLIADASPTEAHLTRLQNFLCLESNGCGEAWR